MADYSIIRQHQRAHSRYGWRPDLPDMRDRPMAVLGTLKRVPVGTPVFSLRAQSPEAPWDQGQLGSCTGHGVGFLDMFARQRQGLAVYRPSRLALYYGGRLLEGDVSQDAGAQIRDVMKTTAKVGAGPEDLWPYVISKFATAPSQAYTAAAGAGMTVQYARVGRSIPTIKRLLYNGYPVVMGFTVYESFESDAVAQTGIMPMPSANEQVLGGHCVAWVGWDDNKGAFETRNSWGTGWGDNGYFYMPYPVAGNAGMSSDFWTLNLIAG